MKVIDYLATKKRYWIRLHEKGGKFHEVPVRHNAEQYFDQYVEVADVLGEKEKLLFRTTKGDARVNESRNVLH
jgi:site-specific recombinase XerC